MEHGKRCGSRATAYARGRSGVGRYSPSRALTKDEREEGACSREFCDRERAARVTPDTSAPGAVERLGSPEPGPARPDLTAANAYRGQGLGASSKPSVWPQVSITTAPQFDSSSQLTTAHLPSNLQTNSPKR
eukprot:1094323-Prymnesium_polylepis.1